MFRQRGFGRAELAIAILILGILGASMPPVFLDAQEDTGAAPADAGPGGIDPASDAVGTDYDSGHWQEIGLPADGGGKPEHPGEVGDPLAQRTFFDAILDMPVEGADGDGSGDGRIDWENSAGWQPSSGNYYYRD